MLPLLKKGQSTIAAIFLLLTLLVPGAGATVLKIGVYDNKPMVFSRGPGQPAGLFIDILEHIAGQEKWQLQYVPGSFTECLEHLQSGQIDLLTTIAYSKERAKLYDFNNETVLTNWGQVYTQSNSRINSLLDLEGKKVAVLMGDIHFKALMSLVKNFDIRCRFIEALDYETVFELIDAGKVHAGLVNRLYGIKFEQDFNVQRCPIVFNPLEIRFAARRGQHGEVLQRLDLHLARLKRNQQSAYHAAMDKWLLIPSPWKFPFWLQWVLYGASGLIVLFLTTSLLLRLKVRERTMELSQKNSQLEKEIVEHGRAVHALSESRERLETILNAVQAGVVIIDKEKRVIVAANPAAVEMVQTTEAELVGSDCNLYFCTTDRNACPVIDLGKTVDQSEREIVTVQGQKVPILKTVAPLMLDGREHLVETFIDLSLLKEAEARKLELETQLQHTKKIEAIGALAGGVAHDLNNVLSGIVSYPELLLLDLPDNSPLAEPIRSIQKSGERAAAIVQDLLTMARRGVPTTEVVDLNHIVGEYLKSPEFSKLAAYHPLIHLETALDENLLNIVGSPIHLTKTIMNLVSNAAEAMSSDGSILSITSSNRYVDCPIDGYETVAEGDYATLVIKDTGIGMLPEEIEHIFEPFYTKKIMGRSGTGLGMAVVWGTVKDHGGYIQVNSEVGKGSEFTLYFPATRKALAAKQTAEQIETFKGRGESILVVDDVQEQRAISIRMLRKLGYTPSSASSGEEAITFLQTQSVDLVVLDMIMQPGMDGYETYRQISKIHPGQKAVIASGYSETSRVKQTQALGAGPYIKKPYLLATIGPAIRQELDRVRESE